MVVRSTAEPDWKKRNESVSRYTLEVARHNRLAQGDYGRFAGISGVTIYLANEAIGITPTGISMTFQKCS